MRRLFLSLTALLMALPPTIVHAFAIDATSVSVLCSILPCNGASGGGAAGLSAYVLDRIITAFEVGIVAAAIISLFISAIQMVAFSTEENTISEARQSYIHIITGLVIVGLARWFVIAFSPPNTGTALVNTDMVTQGVGSVVTYLKLITSITLLVNIVVQAMRLISSQGEEAQVTKAKDRFIAGFIGAGIIMLANVIAVSVVPGYGGSVQLAVEIAGIANYILVILGFLSLLAMVIAGIMLIVSIDETMKDKAKNIIKTSLIGIIVVLTSYALVTAFIMI